MILDKYSYKLLEGVKHPKRGLLEIYGYYKQFLNNGVDGVDIMSQDWDNLIIIDGCRFDLFEELNSIDGHLTSVTSQGAHTGEFQEKTFAGKEFGDTIYVLASPNPANIDAEFADVIHLWVEEWDDKLHTVPPEDVTKRAIQAHDANPNKRLLVHYMQPHYPWIGEKGLQFHEEHGYTFLHEKGNIWIQLRHGELDPDRVWEVYKENLKFTLPHVKKLVDHCAGKTIVTSDHGNAFGEWGAWGHEPRAYIDSITTVPWLTVPSDNRKIIEETDKTVQINYDSHEVQLELVEDRLTDLGYI